MDRPEQKVSITAKWIYKLKKDTNGVVTKLKARIVARGFQQIEGVTFSEIFASVVRWSTIRTILALAANYSWPIRQMDVITAFLNGEFTNKVYMEIPEGFLGARDPTKLCHLKHAMYGLRQAPRVWYDKINSWLQQQNLKQSDSDPNLFYSMENGQYTIVLIYVDHMLITGNNENKILALQCALTNAFDMTDLGIAHEYLGVKFEYRASGIWIHQHAYINKLLKKFQMQDCTTCILPMDPGIKLQKDIQSYSFDPQLYRSLVGSLIYLTNTRPDICYAISCLNRYMDLPQESHSNATKQILRYLKATIDFVLQFSAQRVTYLHSYADADWGKDMDKHRSTSGILDQAGNSLID